ncbi:MAG TPA: efflux RND transporter periplasmic adaptor subunit [Prolixibacteraceae bacterium]|nr:efflux RND transporter periplasmic adaptor subunit [Prolixibacteraceae bacterium]
MHTKIISIIFLAFIITSCGNQQTSESQDHDHEHEQAGHITSEEANGHSHDENSLHNHNDGTVTPEHEHADEIQSEDLHQHEKETTTPESADEHEGHDHEKVKIQLTAYSNNFEVFAEADPFIVGMNSTILAHFTTLPGFNPLNTGSITARLIVQGKETTQTLDRPTRTGIYSFVLEPHTAGSAELIFDIKQNDSLFSIHVPSITIYDDEHEAIHEAEKETKTTELNTVVFTKEQSWKINFATFPVRIEPFGQVIKTTAQVQSAPGDEVQVAAKTNGIVNFAYNNLTEGQKTSNGQQLFTISGSGLANENSEVRFAEAKNNFENAKADYERAKELAEDKIVSEKQLLAAKNRFENARVVFENLKENFNAAGQSVSSPIPGFVKQLHVQNGEYVTAGQPLVTISQNKNLMLHAEVQQKYLPVLGAINSATIRNLHSNETYTLEELNGKITSYGRTATNHNYLLPVTLQIDNKGNFIPGSFAELFLQTVTNARAVTIPNSALLEEQGNFFVMVQLTPELFEKREVKKGASNGLRTEILSGLNGNERVVSEGAVLVKLAQSTGSLDAHSGHVH